MPYQYILANLLARNDEALGVLFLDDSGEAVDVACADRSPYQMRVLGAYLSIHLRQQEKILRRAGLGTPKMLHIEQDRMHIYAIPLPDGYFLALVQRAPALVAGARNSLIEAAQQIVRELFAAG